MDKRLAWGLIFLLSACLSSPATPAPSPTTLPPLTETPLPTPTATATAGPTITGQGRLIYLLGSKVYGGGFSGGDAREIAALGEGQIISPRLRGNRMAYLLGRELRLLDLRQGSATTLFTLPEGAILDTFDLCWSVGGEAIAYTVAYEDPEALTFGRSVEVGVVDLPTGEDRLVAGLQDRFLATLLGYNDASGELFLIPRGADPGFEEIVVYDGWRRDQVIKSIPIEGDAMPDQSILSPELSRLALASLDPEAGTGQILVYDLSVAQPTARLLELPPGTHARYFIWSPDGQRLAYFWLSGAAYGDEVTEAKGLWVWDLSGEETMQVAEEDSPFSGPLAWSLDGDAILAFHYEEGDGYYYLALRDGSGVMRLDIAPEATVLGWVPEGG
ncbi:MAG: TolB family protein [Anaerolineae bacterium]